MTADLPEAYIVPPEWTEAIERLEAHGVALRRLAAPVELDIRTWRFPTPNWQERPYEGHHPVTFTAEPLHETRVFPAGIGGGGHEPAGRPGGRPPAGAQGPGLPGAVGLLRRGLRAGGVRGVLRHRADDPRHAGGKPRAGRGTGRAQGGRSRSSRPTPGPSATGSTPRRPTTTSGWGSIRWGCSTIPESWRVALE